MRNNGTIKNMIIVAFSLMMITSFWLTSGGWTETNAKKILGITQNVASAGAIIIENTSDVTKTEIIEPTIRFVPTPDIVNRKTVQFKNNIDQRVFILRLDDVQAFMWGDVTKKIIGETVARNMSITLGVIPLNLNEDSNLVTYLRNLDDNMVEIAQHGINHTDREFGEYSSLSIEEAQNRILKGTEQIYKATGRYPVTLIPPNNELVSGYELKEIGFRIISGEFGLFYEETGIMYIGYTTTTDMTSPKDNIARCNEEFRNVCVILIHPQDYSTPDGSLDNLKFGQYLELLDELEKTDLKSITFKDLLTGEFKEGSTYYREKFNSSLYESREYYENYEGTSGVAFGLNDCDRLKTLINMLPTGNATEDLRITRMMNGIAWDGYKYYSWTGLKNYCEYYNYSFKN